MSDQIEVAMTVATEAIAKAFGWTPAEMETSVLRIGIDAVAAAGLLATPPAPKQHNPGLRYVDRQRLIAEILDEWRRSGYLVTDQDHGLAAIAIMQVERYTCPGCNPTAPAETWTDQTPADRLKAAVVRCVRCS